MAGLFGGNYPSNLEIERETYIKSNITEAFRVSLQSLQREFIHKEEPIERSDLANDLCNAIEAVFIHGLKANSKQKFSNFISGNAVDTSRLNFWDFIQKYLHKDEVIQLNHLGQITTPIGMCRAWVRKVLNDGVLESYMDLMLADEKSVRQFYSRLAFFRDSEQSGILKTLIQALPALNFALSFNSSVLNIWTPSPLILAGIMEPPLLSNRSQKAESEVAVFRINRQGSVKEVTEGSNAASGTRQKTPGGAQNHRREAMQVPEIYSENAVPQNTPLDQTILTRNDIDDIRRMTAMLNRSTRSSTPTSQISHPDSSDDRLVSPKGISFGSSPPDMNRSAPYKGGLPFETLAFAVPTPKSERARSRKKKGEKGRAKKRKTKLAAIQAQNGAENVMLPASRSEDSLSIASSQASSSTKGEIPESTTPGHTVDSHLENVQSIVPTASISGGSQLENAGSSTTITQSIVNDSQDSHQDMQDSHQAMQDSHQAMQDGHQGIQDGHQDSQDSHQDIQDSHQDIKDSHQDSQDGNHTNVNPNEGRSVSALIEEESPSGQMMPLVDDGKREAVSSGKDDEKKGEEMRESTDEADPYHVEHSEQTDEDEDVYSKLPPDVTSAESQIEVCGVQSTKPVQGLDPDGRKSDGIWKTVGAEYDNIELDGEGSLVAGLEDSSKEMSIYDTRPQTQSNNLTASLMLGWSSDFLEENEKNEKNKSSLLEDAQKKQRQQHAGVVPPEKVVNEVEVSSPSSTEHTDTAVDARSSSIEAEFDIISSAQTDSRTQTLLSLMNEITCEKGLDQQNYQCLECSRPIGMIYGRARVCAFDSGYYCFECHENQESLIPSRILYNWDFRKHKVSNSCAEFISRVEDQALIDVDALNPTLYDHVEEMAEALMLRRQLRYIKAYLFTCCQSIAEELRKMIWPKEYLYDDIHKYTLVDFLKVHSGQFPPVILRVIKYGIKHIYSCNLCKQKGYICEICEQEKAIFPFEADTHRCSKCKSVFHKNCMANRRPCPRCVRTEHRRKISESFKDNDDMDYAVHPEL